MRSSARDWRRTRPSASTRPASSSKPWRGSLRRKRADDREDAKSILVGGLLGLVIAGGITAYWLYDGWRKVWKPYRNYEKTACRVLGADLDRLTDSEGREAFLPRFQISVLAADRTAVGYDLWQEGLTRSQAEKIVASYPTGRDLTCWHPAGKPHEAVLSRKLNSAWIFCGFLFIPAMLLCLFMTGFGIYIWPQRRTH